MGTGRFDPQAPIWVTVPILVAMGGGALAALAELGNWQAGEILGLAVLLAGIVIAAGCIAVDVRQSGDSLISSAWEGLRSAGSLLWNLLP